MKIHAGIHTPVFGSNMVVKPGGEIDTRKRKQESQSQTAAAREVEGWSWKGIAPSRTGTLHPVRSGRQHPVDDNFPFLAIGFGHWIFFLAIFWLETSSRKFTRMDFAWIFETKGRKIGETKKLKN